MGRELLCAARINGKSASGKALLETDEILFRGESRLKIPLASLQSVSSRSGKLHLKWSEGSAVFELGDEADKWAHKILHPKSVAEKLGVLPRLTILAAAMREESFLDDLRGAVHSFSVSKLLNDSHLIFFGADKAADLSRLAGLEPSLSSCKRCGLSISRAGRRSKSSTCSTRAGRVGGWEGVSSSATHTALKFVRSKGNAHRIG